MPKRVRMTNKTLPGRVITVFAPQVRVKQMSGWEVAETDPAATPASLPAPDAAPVEVAADTVPDDPQES